MELKIESDLVPVALDTDDGATASILYYHKGYISGENANKARWFAAQVTEDNKLTITRVTDNKGTVTTNKKKFSFTIETGLVRTGTIEYVNRMSTNRHSNIIQQVSPLRWIFYQVDWVGQTFKKSLDITGVNPGGTPDIIYLTRYQNHLYFILDVGATWDVYYIDLSTHPSHGFVYAETASQSFTADETAICAGEDYLYIMESGDLKLFPHGNLTTPDTTYSSVITETVVELREIDVDDLFVRVSGSTLYRIEGGEKSVQSTALETDTENFRIQTAGDVYLEAVEVTRTPNEEDEHVDNWYITSETPEINAYLSGIVAELCDEVDIAPETDINIAEVQDIIVQGYLISNYSIQDAFIKQLMIAYQFDMVESAAQLKFIGRGQDSSQTIDPDRLGAMAISNQIGNNFPERIGRTLEASRLIPREMKVIYLEQQKDYDQTEQSIIRQDAYNKDQQILDMSAFAWTDSIARQIADKTIALYFSEREQYVFFLSAYYFDIEPSDVITLAIDELDTELRVTETTYSFPGILQVQAVFENQNDYLSEIEGIDGEEPAQDFPSGIEYEPIILDTNYFFDSDYDDASIGLYLTARTLGSTFNPISILRSIAGIEVWTTISSFTDQISVGNCENTLEDGTTTIVDRASSVIVRIDPTLSLGSITEDELLSATANISLIGNSQDGWEILCYKNVTEIGSGQGTWQLDTFLRGIRGTNNFTGIHSPNDYFIKLQTDKWDNETDYVVGQIGASFDYVGIEEGFSVPVDEDDYELVREEFVHRRGLPYSVAHEDAHQDGTNIVITWIRRTRVGGSWEDLVDATESEPSELYEVDILDVSGNVKRTISTTSESATYTLIQQTADFGGAITTLDCNIYKVHEDFGRGYVNYLFKYFG